MTRRGPLEREESSRKRRSGVGEWKIVGKGVKEVG